jgi:hypothetical protein
LSGPADIVAAQLAAYNAQDLDAFCACYAEDAVLAGYNGEITNRGVVSIRERHAKLFADFPQNQAALVHRIVVGSNVIDHEKVSRAPGGESFEVAPIYTIADGKIVRVDFVRGL